MGILSVDLGTTNIKVALFDEALEPLATVSHTVAYEKSGDRVEFSATRYFDDVLALMGTCIATAARPPNQIVLTGQAESLVVVDRQGTPLRNAISWLDMRSKKECEALSRVFAGDRCFQVTGQPHILSTWPVTKILWLRENEPEVYAKAGKYLLLKDYLLYRLTGEYLGEHTVYNFSHYFDIRKKDYWDDILNYCGVGREQLPELVAPCSVAGRLLPAVAKTIRAGQSTRVNVGALDHFAGMIGTGNIAPGTISESAGTVLSLATLLDRPLFGEQRIPLHCGSFPGSYVLLPVCESGGISLEWFRNAFAGETSYREIDAVAATRWDKNPPLFLPYITGSNAPDFNGDATGVFFGIRAAHDRYDFALGVMEGVACLLRKNVAFLRSAGIHADRIVSTGGGSRSALWSQLKADYTGCTVSVPANGEAPSLGAAMIGAVSAGYYPGLPEAIAAAVRIKSTYTPAADSAEVAFRYGLFEQVYGSLQGAFRRHAERG